MSDQPKTPQNRTDGDEAPEEAPANTPQGRADQDEEAAAEGRPGDEG